MNLNTLTRAKYVNVRFINDQGERDRVGYSASGDPMVGMQGGALIVVRRDTAGGRLLNVYAPGQWLDVEAPLWD